MSKENDCAEPRGSRALICIPTYNELENICLIIPAVLEQLPGAHVLIIDDNSPDGTGESADEMAKDDERIHVLHRGGKEGLGKAYVAGFNWALDRDYDKIVEFDADFSHNPVYLPEMLKLLEHFDVVVGSRRVLGGGTENWGPARKAISWAGSFYSRTVLGVQVKDLTGGFNGFKRAALQEIDISTLKTSGYGFQIEIKYRACLAGLKVKEMPIIFKDRERGISKMSLGIFAEAMLQVLRLRIK